MKVISRHPSRSDARAAASQCGGSVKYGGLFGNGPFGLYAKLKGNGEYVGEPSPLIHVWYVIGKPGAVAGH